MKKCRWIIAISTIVLCILLSGVIFAAGLESFQLVAENDHLRMYISENTTEVRIEDRQNGFVWSTNPINWEKEETRVRGKAKNKTGAQLAITYYIVGDEQRTMDNYNDSIVLGQYEIARIEQGVRVSYALGEEWMGDAYLPIIIREQDFQTLVLDKIESEKERKFVIDQYVPIILEELGGRERLSVFGVDKAKTFGNYTLNSPIKDLSDKERQALIDFFIVKMMNSRKDITTRGGVNFSDISQLVDTPSYMIKNLSNWDKDDLVAILKKWDINPTEIQASNKANNVDVVSPNITVFHIPIEYELDGNSVVVRIPTDQIVYPKDAIDVRGRYTAAGSKVTLPLTSIELLPYFGAAGPQTQGYLVVPDGSGGIIKLNSNKGDLPMYNRALYGRDHSLGPRTDILSFPQQSYLPVMGVVTENAAFLGVIESGDSLAQIKASVAGRQSSYNTVGAQFATIPFAKISLSTESVKTLERQHERGIWLEEVDMANAYLPRVFEGDIVIRYSFLYEEEATYSGMAKLYRASLFDHDPKMATGQDIPFILGLTGAIHVNKPVLGVSRRITQPLTTIEQATEIVESLRSAGIQNIQLKYDGWLEGGVEHRYPIRVNVDKSLGSKGQFQEFLSYVSDNQIQFYPAVNFVYRHGESFFDTFRPRRDASRLLDRDVGRYYPGIVASLQMQDLEKYHYIVSPAKYDELITKFLEDYGTWSLDGLYLTDWGTTLSSDFNLKGLVDREQAKDIVVGQFEKLSNQADLQLMVSGGNAYTLPYVQTVVDLPLQSSRFLIVDQDIPLMPLVLSGQVVYAYAPLNYTSDIRQAVLKSVETGAVPYFSWTYAEPAVVKDTEFDYLYASNYQYWFDQAVSIYNEINSVLKEVYGCPIVDHSEVAPDVYKSEYANGKAVIVNYRKSSVSYEGIEIPGRGYRVIGGQTID